MKHLISLAALVFVPLSTSRAADVSPLFRPEFIAIHSREPLSVAPVKDDPGM